MKAITHMLDRGEHEAPRCYSGAERDDDTAYCLGRLEGETETDQKIHKRRLDAAITHR